MNGETKTAKQLATAVIILGIIAVVSTFLFVNHQRQIARLEAEIFDTIAEARDQTHRVVNEARDQTYRVINDEASERARGDTEILNSIIELRQAVREHVESPEHAAMRHVIKLRAGLR